MNDHPVLHGRRCETPLSKSSYVTLTLVHFGEWNDPVDYDAEAKRIADWLADHLPPETLDAMERLRGLANV